MTAERGSRRSYGTGSLIEKGGSWYGKWRIGNRQVMRKLGAARRSGSREGLTRKQAESSLRTAISTTTAAPLEERLTLLEVGDRYLHHVDHVLERKPSTVADYRYILRRHLGPFFDARGIDRITPDEIAAYMTAKARDGLATKTVSNHLNFAHGLFSFAVRRGWATSNPVAVVDRPRVSAPNPDIHYLLPEELEALLRAVPDDALGPIERALYLTAAMTGLRQGELVALRWRDVDWAAGVVRVRRNYTRGRWGTPKSRRSSRAVPMADRVAGELDRHFKASRWQKDDDLVFAHPLLGTVLDASKLRKRFGGSIERAGVRRVRFHDLRHTFGTRMAAAGAPLRSIMEWMGHRDFSTTLVYADFAPDPTAGAHYADRAFGPSTNSSTNLSATDVNTDPQNPL